VAGPCGAPFPVDVRFGAQISSSRCRGRWPRCSQRGGWATGSGCARDAPGGGVGALPFPVSLWPPLSPLALSSSRLGWISAGCGSGCSIDQSPLHPPPPPPAAAWWLAARRCRGRGSYRPPMARGRCGGCEPESRRLRRQNLQPNSPKARNPMARAKPNSPRAKGPRAQEPRREPGGRRQQGRTPT
jgi:hypothetical protein